VSGPGPLGYLLAAVMMVTAGYCMTRLAAARLRRRPTVPDLDISHVVMGVAMAAASSDHPFSPVPRKRGIAQPAADVPGARRPPPAAARSRTQQCPACGRS